MNKRLAGIGIAAALSAGLTAYAADHIDSPEAVGEPTADVTDLYAWMTSDASKVNLIMNVTPFAGSEAEFSDAVQYVFHVGSGAGYGEAQTETRIICQFDASGQIACWAGDSEYVTGDASAESGITSQSGALRVFAGPRNDPFFFEFVGFTEAVDTALAAVEDGLGADAEGCLDVDEPTSAALVAQLQSGMDGADATDTFANENVLSLVVQVDKDIITGGGPLLGVWASTHRR